MILLKYLSNILDLFDLSIIDQQLELWIANWGVLSESGTVGLCNEVENQQKVPTYARNRTLEGSKTQRGENVVVIGIANVFKRETKKGKF